MGKMEKKNKVEVRKWPWTIWVIVVLGFIVFALPISENAKFALAVVLYLVFLFVYFRYVHKRKSS